MKETLATIMERRSIRVFLPKQIKKQELQQVIQAGLYAPSAHNQQSLCVSIVVSDR